MAILVRLPFHNESAPAPTVLRQRPAPGRIYRGFGKQGIAACESPEGGKLLSSQAQNPVQPTSVRGFSSRRIRLPTHFSLAVKVHHDHSIYAPNMATISRRLRPATLEVRCTTTQPHPPIPIYTRTFATSRRISEASLLLSTDLVPKLNASFRVSLNIQTAAIRMTPSIATNWLGSASPSPLAKTTS